MKESLRERPWYLFLLPLFFVVHGYSENFGFIDVMATAILALVYIVAALVVFFLFLLFFRNRSKAALLSSFIMAFYLFFGAIQDFCKIHFLVLSKYSVLLPLFVVLFLILLFYLKRTKKNSPKLNLFLNSLFIIYILIDLFSVLYKEFHPPSDTLAVFGSKKFNFQPCNNCPKPDIYFLLFDEYAGTASLRKHFNYDNNSLDSFLTWQGFHLQQRSRSNYNFTPMSMASMFNMSYLTGLHPGEISIEDYARCNGLIKKNAVINFLAAQGYDIINYSIFDLEGNPSPFTQNMLPLKTKLITDATLLSRLQKDLGWMLLTGRFELKWLSAENVYTNLHINQKCLDLLIKASSTKSAKPRLFYGHLFMPHPPYYFDQNGNRKKASVVIKEWEENNTEAYLEQVTYTNTRIRELVSDIKRNTRGQAVIIVMGDHGFRKATADKDTSHYFENQNAVYFPSHDYHLLYDSVSAVNQFRIILNTLFRQNLPIIKDSTVFLTDKK